MKKFNFVLMLVFVIVVFSLAVLSQISPITTSVTKTNQITPNIGLGETYTCAIDFYDELQDVYADCIYYHNYTFCSNISGPNTGCSLQQDSLNKKCKTGQVTVTKNNTLCKPNNEFTITINQNIAVLKKQIDFSDWGPCIYKEDNNCLIVTCVSNEDGAFQGKFTDCKGGKSCQKFEVCDNSIRAFYKNSREDFVAEDTTFYLSQLALKEVGQ